jgi:hypothetical protein
MTCHDFILRLSLATNHPRSSFRLLAELQSLALQGLRPVGTANMPSDHRDVPGVSKSVLRLIKLGRKSMKSRDKMEV